MRVPDHQFGFLTGFTSPSHVLGCDGVWLGRTFQRPTLMMNGFCILAKVTCPAASSAFLSCFWNRQPNSLWFAFAVFSGNGLVLDCCFQILWCAGILTPLVRTEPLPAHSDSVQTQQLCSVGRGGAGGPSPLYQGSSVVSWGVWAIPGSISVWFLFLRWCAFVFASTSDCVVSSIVLSLFAGSVLETVTSALGGDPERQERKAGKT